MPRSEKRRATDLVCVRFTPAERQHISEVAAQLRMGVSQLVRNALAEALPELNEINDQSSERRVAPDHPHTDPKDGRTECDVCGKWVHECIHSCKGVPVTDAAWERWHQRNQGGAS